MMNKNNSNVLLEVKNLSKQYRHFSLNPVSFTLEKGYIMGLIGPNGAGKTTLLKLIAGLLSPASGSVSLNGKEPYKKSSLRDNIGMVFDDSCFLKKFTPKENELMFSSFYNIWNHERFSYWLHRFSIPENKPLCQLSRGMRTKFLLAFALAHEPELLLLDEPTAGLDPVFRRELLTLLQEFVEKYELGIILSTHITTDLDNIADYITMLSGGNQLFFAPTDRLKEAFYPENPDSYTSACQIPVGDILYACCKSTELSEKMNRRLSHETLSEF